MNRPIDPDQSPKPLPCRLGELLKQWNEQQKKFDAKNCEEASCTIFACSENLKEVVGKYFEEVRAWQASAEQSARPMAQDHNERLLSALAEIRSLTKRESENPELDLAKVYDIASAAIRRSEGGEG